MRKTKEELLRELESIDDEGEKLALKIKIAQTKNQIKGMREVSDDNESYIKFIESLNLAVRANGKRIPVNHETLCNYEMNQKLIEYQLFDLEQKVKSYQQELEGMNK